jgi:hypothetical protein
MKIIRRDEKMLVLAGRQADKEYGVDGLWLLFLVGLSLAGGSLFWIWDATNGLSQVPNATADAMLSLCIAAAIGIAAMALLLFGAALEFKQESLTLDLNRQRGIYSRRWLLTRSRFEREFGLPDVEHVRIVSKSEKVSSGDDLPVRYRKWEARLVIKPKMIIPLCRLQDESKVRRVAQEVSDALGVELVNS